MCIRDRYWITNVAMMGIAAVGRSLATQNNSVRFLWGQVFVLVPFFAIASQVKLDRINDRLGHRKTLEERLVFSPLTRAAWGEAKQENDKYQNQLKTEIATLERQLKERNQE
eukprot:TRINITY_DN1438_c0_g1_i2.p2 TRINITY_DN1438_c0_g1~~TRINITY_DN1438_c0_g1_i2.p2  ORF type:complete len:112 (-),score=27.61 TRINITY_DN1438_c0_g1_i2:80-415(-)